jgi:hypothetical protein
VTPKRLRRRGVTADAPMNFFILTVYDANLSRSEAFFWKWKNSRSDLSTRYDV